MQGELQSLVDSLLATLPSLIHKSSVELRKGPPAKILVPHQTVVSDEDHEGPTRLLLEAAMQLSTAIDKVFDKLSRVLRPAGENWIDESLIEHFKKETAQLLQWSQTNASKLSERLAPRSPEVREALQATVFDMTDLLSESTSCASNICITMTRYHVA